MSRTRWPLAPLAIVATVALVSGCGSSAPAGADSSSLTATNHAKAVRFAECIRSNGVSAFPDPDASGNFTYGIKAGSSLDPSSAAWQKAIAACKDLEPASFMPATLTTQQLEARLKFAQCVRDNGVPSFPDPTRSGPLIDIPDAQSDAGLQTALQKCRALMAEATQ